MYGKPSPRFRFLSTASHGAEYHPMNGTTAHAPGLVPFRFSKPHQAPSPSKLHGDAATARRTYVKARVDKHALL